MSEDETESGENAPETQALGEALLCENLAQTAEWAARWGAAQCDAAGALVWVPERTLPQLVCTGAVGEGTRKALRRAAAKDEGLAGELLGERAAMPFEKAQLLASQDPLLANVPPWVETALAIPMLLEEELAGVLVLLFRDSRDPEEALGATGWFLPHAAAALDHAVRMDRRTGGMLQAIERLTNLYDLTKAFGSTIDLPELCAIIVHKAADFGGAEAASLWFLEEGEVALAATAVNENDEVEPAPAAVGAGVVGDVLAEQATVMRNNLGADDPARAADAPYELRSVLAVPLLEDEKPVGALVLANKRGRHPSFTAADEELLHDLGRQAVRALRNARLYEAEKKVEELDALLTVSREITATLDLDKVMQTIVNASAALVPYDRCAIAVLQKGRVRVGAVSGMAALDRGDPSVKRTESLLEWVYSSGSDIGVTQQEDGSILTDRPETEEKFRTFFTESGRRAFYGVLLKDEEGKLGVLGFECTEDIVFDQETRDLLQILVNQATVAVRNAQLYQQVPLAGFWKPLLEKRRKLAEIPRARQRRLALTTAAVLALLLVVPWRVRVAGPARVVPTRRVTITAPVEGFVARVLHREGDAVKAGDVIATLRDDGFRSALGEARSELEIAESDLARHRTEGDAAAMYQALAKRDELSARVELAKQRLSWTEVRAPVDGVVVTPHLEEKVGQLLGSGAEVCALADTSEMAVEVAVPESEAALVAVGAPLALKMNPYPTRTFRGTVARIGSVVREEGDERFVVVESRVENPGGVLRSGMAGKAKVSAGWRSLLLAILRKPIRAIWLKAWPLLP